MAEPSTHPEELFNTARRLDDPQARKAYLDQACAGNVQLRERIEALLAAHAGAGGFLDPPAGGADLLHQTVPDDSLRERPGTVIGPYKLLEQIGEGGMAVVFLAAQSRPIERKVALKVIRPGMDSHQVIGRFQAERQALALMDHLNIAKIYDAGTTDSGRPYFAMELVKGVPITRYCDEHRLQLRQRLDLFVQICSAVQHAHTKGIIHRDLKPSNVLVAMYDGKAVPKVIDFGIAKATGQPLTDRTMFTGFGTIVGTPQYMSPEQAELNQLDIDTRSDVYSLGVLLYELLTGSTPLEHSRFKAAALLEMLRVVREEEPPKPSTRLTTTEQLPTIAAQRGLEPRKLSGLVRGELDWIVMKALEKDRGRRYETANGLAMDVQRYVAGEPVLAAPASQWYRLRKFVRRYRGPVAAAGLVLLTLLAGIAGTTWGLVQAQRERHSAEAKEREAIVERDAKGVALKAEQQARADEAKAREQAFAALRSMTADVVERKFTQGQC
jgi:serine/threonine protein kinase